MNHSGIVTIDKENDYYMVENNILYSKDKKTLVSVLYAIKGTFTVDPNVEIIGNMAFHVQSGMTEVIIPEGVKEIKNSFNYCGGLRKIEIPSTVLNINGGCFADCTNLDEIVINQEENAIAGTPWGATKGMKVVTWKPDSI